MTKKEAVIKAVQSACPELRSCAEFHDEAKGFAHTPCGSCGRLRQESPEKADPRIQLHHVLRALNTDEILDIHYRIILTLTGIFMDSQWDDEKAVWDMTKDLSSQEDSTIDFLHHLLVK
jgi:hypothetical protein